MLKEESNFTWEKKAGSMEIKEKRKRGKPKMRYIMEKRGKFSQRFWKKRSQDGNSDHN